MVGMLMLTAISVITIYTGLELNIKKEKIAYAFIYISISIFILGVINFAKSNLGFNINSKIVIVYTLIISLISTVYIIKSCKTHYLVGEYKRGSTNE